MSWLDKLVPSVVRRADTDAETKPKSKSSSVPEGLWKKCVKCESVLYRPELEKNIDVCPKCDHHMRIGARTRLDAFFDQENSEAIADATVVETNELVAEKNNTEKNSTEENNVEENNTEESNTEEVVVSVEESNQYIGKREELFTDIGPIDRLKFKDKKKYKDRLTAAQKSTGEKDALIAMKGTLKGMPVVAVAFEFNFHGGSMGYAVGEKFTRAAQLAIDENIPLVCFSASGGARMQEALISLMQMAKTSAVIEKMKQNGVPYISVMTDPIYGGVSASLALLGDVNIAEPGARAGFAGPNIIEQTIRQKLPAGFQRSEFLLDHGAIDMIVHRKDMRDTLASILSKLTKQPAVA